MSSKSGAMRRLLGLVSAVTMVGTGIAPAAARDHGYGWGGYGHHRHYRHRGGLDAGDVIGIAALIGAVAVIASAASKDRTSENRSGRGPDPDSYPDGGRGEPRTEAHSVADEDAAVDACVAAARDEAERNGGYAEVLDVDPPRALGADDWEVEGRIEQRRSWSQRDGETRRFRCDVREGRVADVSLSADMI